MKLNLSDEPITAELLADSLRKTGSAVIAVNGTSMHPTLQMGWRVYLRPARGEDVRVGEIAVFRGERYLTIHRLVFRTRHAGGERLVFRGDYNRVREWIDPAAVIGRVVAVEVPGREKGMERVVAIEPDILARFYRVTNFVAALLRPLRRLRPESGPPGRLGRAGRAIFGGTERFLSFFLPGRR